MSILINIASEFTGAKAFKKAEKATLDLDFSVKKLGKSLGLALSAGAVVAFGKAAAKAFIEDEKAAAMLANTVKSLGLEFASVGIENFISQLSRTSGVLDDELRPAMQKLLTTTGSVAKSQALLTQAIAVSRGSGVDLETVINDLTKAYTGQTKGLEKYKTGLTKAELQAMTFEQIMDKLNGQFKGANAAYMNTYAYKMSLLTVAASEAKETIGKGLVDALMALSGNTDIQGLISDIDRFAQALATTLVYIGKLLAPIVSAIGLIIKYLGGNTTGGAFSPTSDPAEEFKRKLAADKALYPKAGNNAVTGYKMTAEQKANAKAIAAAEALAAKRAKDLANATKKNTAELKKQSDLKKASSIFDLTQIQIIAALKGNISDEERKRLELQLALEQGNVAEAKILTYQLAIAQGLTKKVAEDLASLPAASNPFAAWKGYLDEIELQAKRIAAFGTLGAAPAPAGNASPINPPAGNVPVAPISSPDLVLAQANADFANANNQIKIIVEGGDEVTSLMRFKIQEAAQSGSSVNWSQSVGAYDR